MTCTTFKVASFLSIIGQKHYTLLKNLCAPTKLITDQLSPRPSEIGERFRFHKREQAMGETVAVYIAELRRLAIHCDKTLKDRFVCGLKQEHIQKKLLAEPNLTIEIAIQTAVAMETASRYAMELQGKREHVGINKLSVKQKHGTYRKQKLQSRPVSVTQRKCYQ